MPTIRLFLTAAAAALAPVPAAAGDGPELADGNYFFSYYASPVAELRVGILKVERKGGKATASVLDGGQDETRLHEFAAAGGVVSATVTFGARPEDAPRLRFEGRVDPKAPGRVAGVFWSIWDAHPATLTATDRAKFNGRADHIVHLPVPPDLQEAKALVYKPTRLRVEARKTDDPDRKKELLAEADRIDASRDQETPRLLRKVVREHPGTPAAADAADGLLARAAESGATPAEAAEWAGVVARHAAGYGWRLEAYTALRTAERLAGRDALAAAAIPYAEAAAAFAHAPRLRLQGLKALALAQEKAGRPGDAARTRAAEAELEGELKK